MKVINRQIFESALRSMEVYGTNEIKSPRILAKRKTIKNALIIYYESTEEFEKCKYITCFFEDLEKKIILDNKSNTSQNPEKINRID